VSHEGAGTWKDIQKGPRKRSSALRDEFVQERLLELARGRDTPAEDVREAETIPCDELDLAQNLGDEELRENIKERHWRRAAAIDVALTRLRDGDYGICQECGDQIPAERLKAMPLAIRCRDCQQKCEAKEAQAKLIESRMSPPELCLDPAESEDSSDEETAAVPASDRPRGLRDERRVRGRSRKQLVRRPSSRRIKCAG
jgi:RNA polymerase-binding transcription factor